MSMYVEGAYTCQCRVRHLRTNSHNEQEPGLGVAGSLPDLVPFELVIFHALSIDSDSFKSDCSFALSEKLGRGGEIW